MAKQLKPYRYLLLKQAENNVGDLGTAMENGDLAKNIERFTTSMGR